MDEVKQKASRRESWRAGSAEKSVDPTAEEVANTTASIGMRDLGLLHGEFSNVELAEMDRALLEPMSEEELRMWYDAGIEPQTTTKHE